MGRHRAPFQCSTVGAAALPEEGAQEPGDREHWLATNGDLNLAVDTFDLISADA
jgi:hypothetical protein